MTDQEIFDGIAKKDNKTFTYLYQKHQGQIQAMVEKNNGTETDAMDLFQDGLVGLWTNISQGNFVLQQNTKISTYLYAICRNLWISKLRKKKIIHSIDSNPLLEIEDEINDMEGYYDEVTKLENQFKKLGESCKNLLNLFYYQKSSLKEIAVKLGITAKTAKNNKYRCMKKLKSFYNSENHSS